MSDDSHGIRLTATSLWRKTFKSSKDLKETEVILQDIWTVRRSSNWRVSCRIEVHGSYGELDKAHIIRLQRDVRLSSVCTQ